METNTHLQENYYAMLYQMHQLGEVIYVFNKYLVRNYQGPRIVPGASDTEVKKIDVSLPWWSW